MPRVVPNQREKFENDELLRKLSRTLEVRYVSSRGLSLHDRRVIFRMECTEGHITLAIVGTGVILDLTFSSSSSPSRGHQEEHQRRSLANTDDVNIDLDANKVYLTSRFILNGVCVVWRGWVDLDRLDGCGLIEFDPTTAAVEDELLKNEQEREQRTRQLGNLYEAQRRIRPSVSLDTAQRRTGHHLVNLDPAQRRTQHLVNLDEPRRCLSNYSERHRRRLVQHSTTPTIDYRHDQ